MCGNALQKAFQFDPLDILGMRRKEKKAIRNADAALVQQQDAIAQEVNKKRIARKPVQTILGGVQTPTEGITLGS